ncbi:MAG: hypothetical protein COC24_017445 [Alphaproteobacteria bacterium]|nr:hypothetical protein [Alphaproteobacteria bacterium]
MGINSSNSIIADLQLGSTSDGLVRIYVIGEEVDLPMDFEPDEAREIAAELLAAADEAEQIAKKNAKKNRKPGGRK